MAGVAREVARDPELSLRLEAALGVQAQLEADVYLVSREGRQVPAHRSVLTLFCPSLEAVLASSPHHLASTLLLPHTSFEALCGLLSLLYTGLVPVRRGGEEVVAEVEETAGMLGLTLTLDRQGTSMELAVQQALMGVNRVQEEVLEERVEVPRGKKARGGGREVRGERPSSRPGSSCSTTSTSSSSSTTEGVEARLARAWGEGREEVQGTKEVQGRSKEVQGGRACSLCKVRFSSIKDLAVHIESVHKAKQGRSSPTLAKVVKEEPGVKTAKKDNSWKMTSEEKLAKIKSDFEKRRKSPMESREQSSLGSLGLLRNILPDIKATPVTLAGLK